MKTHKIQIVLSDEDEDRFIELIRKALPTTMPLSAEPCPFASVDVARIDWGKFKSAPQALLAPRLDGFQLKWRESIARVRQEWIIDKAYSEVAEYTPCLTVKRDKVIHIRPSGRLWACVADPVNGERTEEFSNWAKHLISLAKNITVPSSHGFRAGKDANIKLAKGYMIVDWTISPIPENRPA